MEFYNDKIEVNAGIELVHISLDLDADSASGWAKKASLPWPTILYADHDKEVFTTPFFDGDPEAPSYILVDATGKMITKDKTHALAKINMLK